MSTGHNPKKNTKTRSEKRYRECLAHCRLLVDEKNEIKMRAGDLRISVSQYLRDMALGTQHRPPRKRLPTVTEKLLAQTIGQLGRVGNNLNQLTHLSHIEGQVADSLKLSATLTELRAVLSSLVEVIE